MMSVIGVDVGRFGVLVDLSDVNEYLPMPIINQREGIDLHKVNDWIIGHIRCFRPTYCTVCIEQQWTFGREGRVSLATLMIQYGQLLGYFSNWNLRVIPVCLWKKHSGVSSKQDAIDLVGEMYPELNWPKRKPYREGLADAILIAKYGGGR